MTPPRSPRFPVGTIFTTRHKQPRICRVTDILRTFNSAGDLVRVRYVAEHQMLGQTVVDYDVAETTIAMGIDEAP